MEHWICFTNNAPVQINIRIFIIYIVHKNVLKISNNNSLSILWNFQILFKEKHFDSCIFYVFSSKLKFRWDKFNIRFTCLTSRNISNAKLKFNEFFTIDKIFKTELAFPTIDNNANYGQKNHSGISHPSLSEKANNYHSTHWEIQFVLQWFLIKLQWFLSFFFAALYGNTSKLGCFLMEFLKILLTFLLTFKIFVTNWDYQWFLYCNVF